jgi:hypothetical protein
MQNHENDSLSGNLGVFKIANQLCNSASSFTLGDFDLNSVDSNQHTDGVLDDIEMGEGGNLRVSGGGL